MNLTQAAAESVVLSDCPAGSEREFQNEVSQTARRIRGSGQALAADLGDVQEESGCPCTLDGEVGEILWLSASPPVQLLHNVKVCQTQTPLGRPNASHNGQYC